MFKFSAIDVPEWAPGWVKDHPEIESKESLKDLPKDIPIENFREDISDDILKTLYLYSDADLTEAEAQFYSDYIEKLRDASFNIAYDFYRIEYDIRNNKGYEVKKLMSLQSFFLDFYKQLDKRIKCFKTFKTIEDIVCKYVDLIKVGTPEEKEVTKTINIPAGTSIAKAAKVIEKVLETLYNKKYDLDPTTLNSFNMYSKRQIEDVNHKSKFSVVFSTDAQEILAMSSRGLFNSCQNLFPGSTPLNERAIYSAISRYTGIIYITNNRNFQGRGDQIIARALVFYVEDSNDPNLSPHIGLSLVYMSAGDYQAFRKFFFDVLTEHSPLPVVDLMASPDIYYFPNQEKLKKYPYFDPPSIKIKPEKTNDDLYREFENDAISQNIKDNNKSGYREINDIIYSIQKAFYRTFRKNSKIYKLRTAYIKDILQNKKIKNIIQSEIIKKINKVKDNYKQSQADLADPDVSKDDKDYILRTDKLKLKRIEDLKKFLIDAPKLYDQKITEFVNNSLNRYSHEPLKYSSYISSEYAIEVYIKKLILEFLVITLSDVLSEPDCNTITYNVYKLLKNEHYEQLIKNELDRMDALYIKTCKKVLSRMYELGKIKSTLDEIPI